MEVLKYDVCIIGSGPAGFSAATRSYDFGNHVAIIEANSVGGAGVDNGALSSKTFWELSNDYYTAKRNDRGYSASGIDVVYNDVKNAVSSATQERKYHLISQIETFAKKSGSTKSITLIRGFAKFDSKKSIIVLRNDGSSVKIEADNFIVATGSTPREHPTLKVNKTTIINSDHISLLEKFPDRILIIGAGIIGCEFATIFGNFGKTKVHILDSRDRVVPFEDTDVSNYVEKQLTNAGVRVHHQVKLREIIQKHNCIEAVLDYEDGHSEVIPFDVILISIGRVPNTDKIGLENTDVKVNDRGIVEVNNECKAGEHIYAIGDISGHNALVNIAEMEGRFAAKAINSKINFELRYENMATIMFFKPEVSGIGLTEKEAREKKIAHKVITYKHSLIPRAIAMRATEGFYKIIATDEEDPLILGMRAAGPQSDIAVILIANIMDSGLRVKNVMKTVHPHPSISEGIQEILRILSNKSILKPKAFPNAISFKSWSPSD